MTSTYTVTVTGSSTQKPEIVTVSVSNNDKEEISLIDILTQKSTT